MQEQNIPDGWEETTLGAMSNIFDSKRIPLSTVQRQKRQGKYPYYGASRIVDYIDDYIFDGEYLLVSEDGENLNTRNTPIAFIAKGKFWVNNHAHILQGKREHLTKYLCWYFSNVDITPYITGAVQPKLSKANLLRIPILLPKNVAEQRAIAAVLSSLDDKTELLREQNKTLEAIAQAIFKEWFVDFNFPDEQGRPYKKSGGKMVESELGEIPEGWRVGRVTDVADILSGGTPKTDTKEYWGGNIPFFTPKDATDSSYTLNTEKQITELGLSKCNSRLYPANTIFITARGTVGKCALAGRDMAMNQSCYALKGRGVSNLYVFLLIKTQIEKIQRTANGAVFDAITVGTFQALEVPVPPNTVEEEFIVCIRPLFEKLQVNQFQIHILSTLRDILFPHLMIGSLRVFHLLDDNEGTR